MCASYRVPTKTSVVKQNLSMYVQINKDTVEKFQVLYSCITILVWP